MILERLEITGFGCLFDISEDLHPRVTVIAGRNESGKSTLLRAVRAALYGIDAGGQGRPVERSDWARYEPWTRGGYGLALTYKLDDGRRIRVARRFDTREQSVQVLELGGSELTDELRSGRAVTPGRFHLGIDEAVFCATAWLGDDGLRIDAPEGARQRAGQLQEAIERLADTRRGVTAAQAMARLRDAMERVGSERRLTSPLGVAASRLRALDRMLDEARARLAAVALDQERLADLDAALGVETERWIDVERARLGARLADTADRRARLTDLVHEAKLQTAAFEATRSCSRFPIDAETEVTALGGELAQARAAAADASARWESAAERLRPIRARRDEIARGIAAIGTPTGSSGLPGSDIGERAQRLRGELMAAASIVNRETGDDAHEAALRREIAATGLRGLPAGVIDDLLPQLEEAGRSGRRFGLAAVLIAIVAAVSAIALARTHTQLAPVLAIAIGVVAAAVCAWRSWARARAASRARAAARQLALEAGADPWEVERLAGRLPVLRALHAALDDTEHRTSRRRADAEATQVAIASLLDRCQALAVEAGVARSRLRQPATVEAAILIAGETLDRVDATVLRTRRREELVAEDAVLAADDAASAQLRDDVDRCARNVASLESRLRALLERAGILVAGELGVAVAGFRHACKARRRHDEARRRLADLHRSARSLGGDSPALVSLEADLADQLRQRGGDPAVALASPPPDALLLQQLDLEAERARRAAASASDQARELRARLGGVLDTLPVIADLEDERDSCAAARERGLRQLKALHVASDMIESASRVTHRELAPRLAASLGNRLSLLTGARYVDVNVDTDHFALGLLGRTRPDMVPLDAVSHGTRDQVALLLRLALCEVLGGAGERAPLLLDEPLLTSDPARRDLFIEFLHDVSATHQVLISTADPAMIEAVSRVTVGDCAVVRLDDPISLDLEGSANAVGRHSARMRLLSGQG
jgi:energy-coupling factor transporter ATP-binding protein EcfA2